MRDIDVPTAAASHHYSNLGDHASDWVLPGTGVVHPETMSPGNARLLKPRFCTIDFAEKRR